MPALRFVALALLVATCWAVVFATAGSHTDEPVLRSTSPGNQQTDNMADRVELTFDRPVPAGLATVRIINPPGNQVVFERPVHPDGRADTISVPMPKTRYGGTYTVAWTLPSAGLEPLRGAFTFNVFAPTDPVGVPEIATKRDTAVAVVHAVARFAAVAAFVVLVGAVFFVAAIWPAGARRRAVRRLVICSWLGLVLATIGVLVWYGPFAAWAPLGDVLDLRLLSGAFESAAGATLLTRLYVLVPVTFGLVQLMTAVELSGPRERWARGGAVLGCAAALAATWSLPAHPQPLNLAVDVVLTIAVAVLVGGLVVLGMCNDSDLSAVSRFSRTVVVCAVLIIIAGGYLGWRRGLAAGSHGWLLAGLLALLVLLAVSCGLIRRRLRASGSGNVGRRAFVATGGAVLILSATAILVVSQPPWTAYAQDPRSLPAALRLQAPPTRLDVDTGNPDRGALDLALVPDPAGSNPAGSNPVGSHRTRIGIHLSLLDRAGAANDGATVAAVLHRPGRGSPSVPISLRRAGLGYWTASVTLSARGQWELALTVRTADGRPQELTQVIDID